MEKIATTVVGYIEQTGKALGLSTQVLKQAAAEKKAAVDMVPGLVKQLQEARLLPAGAEKQASSELSNHAQALTILSDVITLMGDRVKQAASDRAALVRGEVVPDDSRHGAKAAGTEEQEDADLALLRMVPGLADKYRNR